MNLDDFSLFSFVSWDHLLLSKKFALFFQTNHRQSWKILSLCKQLTKNLVHFLEKRTNIPRILIKIVLRTLLMLLCYHRNSMILVWIHHWTCQMKQIIWDRSNVIRIILCVACKPPSLQALNPLRWGCQWEWASIMHISMLNSWHGDVHFIAEWLSYCKPICLELGQQGLTECTPSWTSYVLPPGKSNIVDFNGFPYFKTLFCLESIYL